MIRQILTACAALTLACAPLTAQALPPSVAAGVNPANSVPYTANLDPTLLQKFRLAISNTRSGVSDTVIACIGDSLCAGIHDADSYTGARSISWVHQLALMGVAGLPTSDDSWFGDASTAAHSASWPSYDPRINLGTGWAPASGGTAVVGGTYITNTTTTNTLDFTTSKAEDTATLLYMTNPSSGSFTWSVDSGSASAPISENSARGVTGLTISLGSASVHTIHIARSSGTVYMVGEDAYNSTTKSVRLWNAGASGSKAFLCTGCFGWNDTTYGWSPGNTLGTAPYTPNLCIIETGVNDANAIYDGIETIAQFTTAEQALISNCQKTGDVVLLVPFPSATATTPLSYQSEVWGAINTLAANDSLPVISWQGRVISMAAAQSAGFANASTSYHPSTAGYADFAGAIAQALRSAIGY